MGIKITSDYSFYMDGAKINRIGDININAEITAENNDTIYKPLNISVKADVVNNKAFRSMKRKHRRMLVRRLIVEGLQTCFRVMI